MTHLYARNFQELFEREKHALWFKLDLFVFMRLYKMLLQRVHVCFHTCLCACHSQVFGLQEDDPRSPTESEVPANPASPEEPGRKRCKTEVDAEDDFSSQGWTNAYYDDRAKPSQRPGPKADGGVARPSSSNRSFQSD